MSASLLIVDDEQSIREILAQVLGYEGYQVTTAASGGEALHLCRGNTYDLVILDVKMQGIDGLDTLSQLREQDPAVKVVMISGHGTIGTAVQAVKEGAFDFLEKPLDSDRLLVTIKRALEYRWLAGENARLRKGLELATDTKFAMVGNSDGLKRIRSLVVKVGPTNARVLVTGENGSGKELVARAIHEASERREKAFVEVNCAAIPSELVESELFGHMRGAFTGAVANQEGKFEAADGGTLFLDEIGDLALNAQAKILRALEEGVIVRVGGSNSIKVDVRVIAATNRELETEITEGRFREDLYHRLNVMPIEVPPLRERISDLPDLVSHFVSVLGQGPGMSPKQFTSDALRRMQKRRWTGNVRELRNAVERLLILSPGPEVSAEDIDSVLPHEVAVKIDAEKLIKRGDQQSFQEFKEEAERVFVAAKLKEHFWNVAETARVLDIPRSNLYSKIEKYKIERDN